MAVGWLVYARTGSAYNLGLVGLAQFLPMVALTFVVLLLADLFTWQLFAIGVASKCTAGLIVWLTLRLRHRRHPERLGVPSACRRSA